MVHCLILAEVERPLKKLCVCSRIAHCSTLVAFAPEFKIEQLLQSKLYTGKPFYLYNYDLGGIITYRSLVS